MKITKDYVLLCENILSDSTGKVTIVNAFDTVYTQDVPTVQMAISFIAQLIVNLESTRLKNLIFILEVNSPTGQQMLMQELRATVGDGTKEQKNIVAIQLNGMPLPEFGEYAFNLKHNDKVVATRTLTVIKGGIEDATIKR